MRILRIGLASAAALASLVATHQLLRPVEVVGVAPHAPACLVGTARCIDVAPEPFEPCRVGSAHCADDVAVLHVRR